MRETAGRALTPTLGDDERELLAERVLQQLHELDEQIAEQKATVADATPAARPQARRLLQRLQRWADSYYRRLHRIRAGGPDCRRCGRRLTYDRLDAQLLAVDCGGCEVPIRRHPSSGAWGDA